MIGSLTNDCVGNNLRGMIFERCIAIIYGHLGNSFLAIMIRRYSGAVQILCQHNTASCHRVFARVNA